MKKLRKIRENTTVTNKIVQNQPILRLFSSFSLFLFCAKKLRKIRENTTVTNKKFETFQTISASKG